MAFIVDFLLLAASGAACFYCWVLSTRIKSVTNTKDGIHSGIVALTQSAEEIQTAIASTKDAATENAATLEQLLADADKRIPELRDLMKQLTEISQTAVEETESATKKSRGNAFSAYQGSAGSLLSITRRPGSIIHV